MANNNNLNWKRYLENTINPAIQRSSVIHELVLDHQAIAQTGALVKRHFEGKAVLLFADQAGFAAAGSQAVQSLKAAGFSVVEHVIAKDPLPKASVAVAETFVAALASTSAIPIALGSGIINDLVKYSAYKLNRPYCSIATAASMDGYASAGASLSQDGFKKTIPASAPRLIIADLGIITQAPSSMTSWGYGDLAGKVPAGGDWLIADALGIEPVDAVAWALVQDNLKSWLQGSAALGTKIDTAIANLFLGLTVVGLAMEFYGSSRPASGADHQIAHLWEMKGLQHQGVKISHGACVAVGCVAVLKLFDWLIQQDFSNLDPTASAHSAPSLANKYTEIAALMQDAQIIERAKAETKSKHASIEEHMQRLEQLKVVWPQLKQRLEKHLMRAPEMIAHLKEVGAPTTASEIGVNAAQYKTTIYACRFIRNRYTVLDLLSETGLLEQVIEEIF